MLKCPVFKCGLYCLSVRDALAKTESKTDLKTRFYARKSENAFLLYKWGDTTVCLDDTTVSESPVGDDTTVCLYNMTVSYSPVRDDTTVCLDDATVSVLQNSETSFFRIFVYF